MDLCLMIEGQEGVTWDDWVALARACEAHGVPALFRSDHYQNLDGADPTRTATDAWATLSALGALTTTLRLGTLVSPATFRHPSVLAKMVATADHISKGRVELGLGAGWHEGEHAAYGFAFAPTRTRMDVLEEQLQIVLGSWGEDPFSFAGEHYELTDLHAHPKPVQSPHPPIIMGGVAGPRSARMAARYADEYNTVFAGLDEVITRRDAIARACEKAGRARLPFSLMTGLLVAESEAELRSRAQRLAAKMGADAGALISDPPTGWIVGTVEPAAEQLRGLREAGLHRVMCQQLLHEDLEAVALLGERLAPLVAQA
jgi:F420-dependent oxidoreductase-like protein